MEKMLTSYEAMLIVSVANGDEAAKTTVSKFVDMIAANGEIVETAEWGRRRLAYPIQDMAEGYYVVVTFKSEGAFPAELLRIANIDEAVIRSLVVKLEYDAAVHAEKKKAEAAAAYRIQEEEQRKVLEITATNADIAKQEREVELKAKEAEVKEQELAATIRKQAEAEKYRIEQNAQADLFKRQKEAEAKKYEETQRAEAEKVKAEAAKFAKEQEAAGIAAIGCAEAEAIQQKGLAEAEALERKAEAMAKYGRAAILEMIVNTLPEMAAAIAKPLESIDKVTIIDGGGNGNGGG